MLRLIGKNRPGRQPKEQPSASRSTAIRLIQLQKNYGTTPAVTGIDLTVVRGTTMALFGPSGCGKTTLLRLIAGLEKPDRGEIWLDNNLATSNKQLIPPYARNIGMVFQDLALWPHMTAVEHIIFAMPKSYRRLGDKKQAANRVLQQVRMTKAERYPHQLSGGEQQRLALARALATNPRLLLLDEPFSSLDEQLRDSLLGELQSLIKELGLTTIYVTHDTDEAAFLADEIAIMNQGVIDEIVSPQAFHQLQSRKKSKITHISTRIQNQP